MAPTPAMISPEYPIYYDPVPIYLRKVETPNVSSIVTEEISNYLQIQSIDSSAYPIYYDPVPAYLRGKEIPIFKVAANSSDTFGFTPSIPEFRTAIKETPSSPDHVGTFDFGPFIRQLPTASERKPKPPPFRPLVRSNFASRNEIRELPTVVEEPTSTNGSIASSFDFKQFFCELPTLVEAWPNDDRVDFDFLELPTLIEVVPKPKSRDEDSVGTFDFEPFISSLPTVIEEPTVSGEPTLEIAKKLPNGVYDTISKRKLYHIQIVRWEDPYDFWVALKPLHDSAEDLDSKLQEFYNANEHALGPVDVSQGSACAFKDRGKWHRGLMKEVVEGAKEVIVRFVDGGRDQFVDLVDMRPLIKEFADLPPTAISARCFGVLQQELDMKLIKKANAYFSSLGKDFACRFVKVEDLYSFKQYPIELYPLKRLDEVDPDLEFCPYPDEDLIATCGLFKLSRGYWRNFSEPKILLVGKKRPAWEF